MGISQSELSFRMMQFGLPNKKHMVKTAGKLNLQDGFQN